VDLKQVHPVTVGRPVSQVYLLIDCQSSVWHKAQGDSHFYNANIAIPMGAVNLDGYLPSGYTAAYLNSCGPSSFMDGIQVAYYSGGGNASCGAIMGAPGIHSFSGSSWFKISGYWK